MSVQDAIRRAWERQTGLQAGEAMVERARAEASAMRSLRLPTLSVGLAYTRTDEPMAAFGTRLDQARISQMDFMPSRLNSPDPVSGTGATVNVSQPLYAGGRLEAARRAGEAMGASEAAAQSHRKQQVALAVTQAYFGVQVAQQAVGYAEDTLKQAQETERFVTSRVEQGLMLKSEGDRAKAFRAQAQAGVAEARQRMASARSGLALLLGGDAVPALLVTPLETLAPESSSTQGARGDLLAARFQWEAARAGVAAAKGSLKPEVGLALTAGRAHYAWNAGGNWTTVSLGAKWTFSFSDRQKVNAARATARAAELGLKWQEQQASREVEDARRAIETAQAKIEASKVAVEASESVRAIRTARHREGLLPLLEVLDAESGLSGARTLLLNSRLEERIGRARLALAQGQPIEDVKE